MITCPWCGTSYPVFQSNCKNCGGPLPAVTDPQHAAVEQTPPPLTPRPISDRYAWRLILTNSIAIAGLVFAILGVVFTLVGIGLTLGVITAFVGIPFLVLGLFFLVVGGGILIWRYQEAMKIVDVLRCGETARGQVTDVRENYSVSVNNRHPWIIEYQFRANGQNVNGTVTTLNRPAETLRPGQPAFVLYKPDAPQYNALYPHP